MRFNGQNSAGSGFITLASFVLVAAVLYFAKDVLVPIALASLLSFLLAPLVDRLARWGMRKGLAVIVVAALAFSVLAVVGFLVTSQLIQLAGELPKYQENLQAKIKSLKQPRGSGVLSKTTGMVKQLQKEIESLAPSEDTNTVAEATSEAAPKPVPVEVQATRISPFQMFANVAGPVLKPLGTGAVVAIFVIFMLLQKEDLRDRFIKLVSGGELNVATQAVDDAANRVSRYLIMQLVVNATYGIPIGVGLYFIGIPNAFLWGLLATLLRFIPFLGPWIAAFFPIALAFAVDPGWTKPFLTIGLFIVIELISNNLVEPLLYGASTGISTVALLAAAVFWTWLWGAVGLLLSAPLTVCLMVIGKYVPGLGFLSVLLGSEPVLEPEARFYQRMLAMDEEELLDICDEYLQGRGLPELYDSVIIPALMLAEHDRHKGTLAEVRQNFIMQNTRELIEVLGAREETPPSNGQALVSEHPAAACQVVCMPARDDADEIVALMLAQCLQKSGVSCSALSAKTLFKECSDFIRQEGAKVVCVSALPPFAITAARHQCARLKSEFPHMHTIVGVWESGGEPTETARRLASSCPDGVVTRIVEAVARIKSVVEPPPKEHPESAASEAVRKELSEELRRLLPGGAEPEELFHSLVREVASILDVPVSMISFLNTDGQFWKSHAGLPADFARSGEGGRENAICGPLASGEDLLLVEDVSKDERLTRHPALTERGIVFYANLPLRAKNGHVVGRLCVTDTRPHQITEDEKGLLRSLCDSLMHHLEGRQLEAA
jgi:predicted PurR-regulated permease PerM